MKINGQGENQDHAVFQILRKYAESVRTFLNTNLHGRDIL